MAKKMKKSGPFKKSFLKYWDLYLLILPALIYLIIFKYIPIYGTIIAFQDYSPAKGVLGSKWVGFNHFVRFFRAYNFKDILWNTISLSLYQLIVSFPTPIILALVLNEIKIKSFKKTVQTVTYAPYFLSTVVMVAMIEAFLYPDTGILNNIIIRLGGENTNYMTSETAFQTIFVLSHIWKATGWGSIIYMSALTSVDPQLYEAAIIDGAGKFKQLVYITLPAIAPTAIIMLIRSCGSIMNVGFEKIYLMQNDLNIGRSEVISTYVYKVGMLNIQYSYSTAVNIFNSLINLVMLLIVNKIARSVSETSLW